RGGLADALNEFSEKSRLGIVIYEDKIPIKEPVKAACDMLGLDPLEIGNEGKVVVGVIREKAEEALELLRGTDEGRDAAVIGEVTDRFTGVVMETVIGGKRIIPRPIGDPVPRIC
ncbi:MAG: AIR synthase-related protein, partial [Candidatus Bathyarchaeota archaeon]|nr:AIR synthase-related protein [Candidatus Bathyarchaeota archaeon]